ncbi:retrovirus-related Pol polyprotein from transposon 412 [Trichonephila clavipes]|uniref:RNA-directed DNA polymerase n=2 Tax=Trichonephila clavipes TaxID=2585209 RepID=A0A8X6SAI6_TRICX|nr:retrovirus-related Pol polyprotein from transposon 412 [Trichonephila clavipes]
MEQQIADLLRQNQDLIRALQIREDSHSHKVTVQFEKFDEENENFDSFIERFETYLDVQNVPIANRAKVFVSSLSAKLYQLLKNLLAPDIPSDQTLDKLKDALKKHLTPKPLIIPSRHKFLNRKQTEGEGISTYIAELRALAMNCDYDKDMLSIMLRDVFVSGLRDKMILYRLFEEDNINLEKTLNIALAMEKAFRGTNDIMGRAINSMQTFKNTWIKNPILQKAERKHYIVHDAQVPTMQKRIVDLFQVNVISVGKLGTLNRHASHLKRQMRNRLNKNRKISKKPIKPTNIVFKTYKGDSIIPLGYVTVRVQYKNQKVNLNLYIVKENLDTILGREWLYKIHLDWPAIKAFRAKTEQNLNNLLREYKDIFDDKLGEINNYEAKLKLRHGVKPIFCRVRTVPFALKGRVENEIDRLEKEGIIEKVDSSEWATPVVPVVKSDGSIRLCADYSVTLNPNLIVPQHPLPRLDEIFGSLNGGKQFTKLDFKHAYLQMKVHPDSQKLMTINTHKGLYICKRLMYGLNGAPAIWQRYVDGLFQGMDGVKVFMDDARITGSDEISHFTALEEFFKKCREHGLKLNLNKSKFFQNEINFLGHRIDSKGLHKTDEKISAVVNAPVPRNVHEKNVRFLWSKDCQVAFEQIKKEICSPKILVHYDPSLPLTLASDASPVGIGCVLSHVYPDGSERPIAFASRTLSGSEKKYSQIDKEALSIVWALFLVQKEVLPVLAATRLLHYALILQSFEFDIIFRKTIEHGNADFLSRLPKTSEELEVKDDITIFQMSQIEALPVTSKELRQETSQDIELGPLLRALREGKDLQGREAQYTIEDGCIMYGQRVCISRKFRKNVLEELHAGHLGIVKMKAIARSFVYWKNIDNDIEEAAKNCVDCARYKADPPKSKVHYWEYPSMPWERIHVDFAGPIF